MTAEERISHANNLINHPSWAVFVKDMMELKELKASELTSAMLNDRATAGAFSAGFRLALETAIEYPQRTIKKNKSVLNRIKDVFNRDAEPQNKLSQGE